MQWVAFIIAIHFIFFTARFLFLKYNAQITLLFSGTLMLIFAYFVSTSFDEIDRISQPIITHMFASIKDALLHSFQRIGLVIMIIGGFVAYMKKIGASNALVYLLMQPLAIFKRNPHFAAILVIPIGQLLFICIPSATGLGLLLVATIFPVLISIGVSRLSAVSVIVACTVFDLGPASTNAGIASDLLGKPTFVYFMNDQLPFTIPLTIIMMILFYFNNRYFDRKEGFSSKRYQSEAREISLDVPLIYAILPVLPFILLLSLSSIFSIVPDRFHIDTSIAMLMTLFVAIIFEIVRKRNIKTVFNETKSFWTGMGRMFSTVITLLVAAAVFTKGLGSLGFMDTLIEIITLSSVSSNGVIFLLASVIFIISIITGSGSASFYSFAQYLKSLPVIHKVSFILPFQMSSGMGRAVSPISGVVVAASELSGVSPFELSKRNAIPLSALFIIMVLLSYL